VSSIGCTCHSYSYTDHVDGQCAWYLPEIRLRSIDAEDGSRPRIAGSHKPPPDLRNNRVPQGWATQPKGTHFEPHS
jgi:hypothetical protein